MRNAGLGVVHPVLVRLAVGRAENGVLNRSDGYRIVSHERRGSRFCGHDFAVLPNVERRAVSLRRFAGHVGSPPQRAAEVRAKASASGLPFVVFMGCPELLRGEPCDCRSGQAGYVFSSRRRLMASQIGRSPSRSAHSTIYVSSISPALTFSMPAISRRCFSDAPSR